ncbi:hypothetical protein [Hydrogenophaga sp. SL48]|uniref:hypothetical protein n=1 Tax=Hydrogenophaga sp. SL48 TaxID=2806347 RepID=UPI001F212969|nr:hypothetical protein [Hydrogenophaga sp. SL48]UJW80319.1 hypothetical protein IM738_21080 [Hydrogenophaga sp. SL48]
MQIFARIKPANFYLLFLVIGSLLVSTVEVLAYWRDAEPSSEIVAAWPVIFLVLLVLWVVEDSKAQPGIEKPFEFEFLVFIWAIPYLPYYLWRTRRWRGMWLLTGLVLLYFLGYLGQWAVYLSY